MYWPKKAKNSLAPQRIAGRNAYRIIHLPKDSFHLANNAGTDEMSSYETRHPLVSSPSAISRKKWLRYLDLDNIILSITTAMFL